MTALNIMLNEIHFHIPREILNLAFSNNTNYRNPITSIDDEITTQVFRKKLLVDLNLASQEQVNIPLGRCKLLFSDGVATSFQVPKSLTEGRSIVSVHGVLSGFHLTSDVIGNTTKSSYGASTLDASMDVLNNLDNVNIIQSSRTDLIAENTVLISVGNLDTTNLVLSAVLENESNLNNMNPKVFKSLAYGALLAAKAYIYNTMVVKINQGTIYAGHDLSIIKDIATDEYRDAHIEYREWYEDTWKKTAFLQNSKAMDKFITSMFANTL